MYCSGKGLEGSISLSIAFDQKKIINSCTAEKKTITSLTNKNIALKADVATLTKSNQQLSTKLKSANDKIVTLEAEIKNLTAKK